MSLVKAIAAKLNTKFSSFGIARVDRLLFINFLDPGLTLTYFMARSNLVLYAFVWDKGKTVFFFQKLLSSMI